ncbi:PDZ domain-containing protein [Patescibacteria group bacterium]|nr:PDZ domain-containing protein [Patescibacteria group bacterium]
MIKIKQKVFIFSLSFFGLIVFAQFAKAVTVAIGPNASEIKQTYVGSFLVEDNNFQHRYWYIEPTSQERYLIKDGVSVSKLLKKIGEATHNIELDKISSDYNKAYDNRGEILIQVDEKGEAWYINPIDLKKYYLQNGKDGFATIQKLALDISTVKLNAIPITKDPEFDLNSDFDINFGMYNTVKETLKNNFFKPDKVKDLDLFYGSLKGMSDSLGDQYTTFYTPNKNTQFKERLEGQVEGIGAMVDTINGLFTIISPLEGSPAQRVGLLPDDQVLFVDGVDISGYLLEDATELIKGPAGTEVTLNVYRPSENKYFDLTITREKIQVQNVSAKMLNNNIAYIKINMFSLNTKSEFDNIKNNFIKDDTRGIIIDLRNNPGGYTDPSVNIADYFLPEGVPIFFEEFPNISYQYTSRIDKEIDIPTVILVNGGTASAAEIFSSALQENGRAQLVGQLTFGKGTGQSLQNFADGSALKYTIFEWLTAKRNSIEDVGITPDYIVENNPYSDLQLQKALDLLK